MRYIDLGLINTHNIDFIEWQKKARKCFAELDKLQNSSERKAFLSDAKNNLWSDFKEILIQQYGKKCWYSECSLEGSFGDVDHFRPKSKSLALDKSVILDDGYWWLAYDYVNYRLSCEVCNRRYGEGGKWDYFPLKKDTRPAASGGPCEEEYLLLDPCNSHDVSLIGYNEEGRAIPLTNDPWEKKRVKNSRWIYNLDCFNSARREVQCKCKTALEIFEMFYEDHSPGMAKAIQMLVEYTNDNASYSTIAKQYISLKIEGAPYADELARILRLDYDGGNPPSEELELAAATV